ncbi:DUF6318 family protein [Kribbella sp. CA-293567]|uniref:DUF6318 family protein n=1 Tax=Kribbella sp. CA-293567 TaxID=3002436 RepID=UPI0022DE023B|nr:DUF6318 family protein [Kribbella sp. CA-293567]WBQ04604.1 DUF6318 family protein [Kribbella sp. CA-293567]
MTTRNRQATISTLACLCAALLTACNNDSPDAGRPNTAPPPSPSSSATSTASAPSESRPTTSPTPTAPPERPDTATGLTLASAEAFIGYFVSLQNYAYATGDVQYLLAASDKGCLGCKGITDYLKVSNGSNGGLSGDYLDRLVEVKEIVKAGNGKVAGTAKVSTGAYTERLSPSATPVARPAASATLAFTLSPSGNNWLMYEMEINE